MCEKGLKMSFSRTLLHLVFKIYIKKTEHSSKVFFKWMEIFHQKQVILDIKVFKMQRDSRVTLHVSPQNPVLEENLKITYKKYKRAGACVK